MHLIATAFVLTMLQCLRFLLQKFIFIIGCIINPKCYETDKSIGNCFISCFQL
jgi:hypothetical protein